MNEMAATSGMTQASFFSAAIVELVSLIWMELALIIAAGLLYILCVGGLPWRPAATKKAKSTGDGDAEKELRQSHECSDRHRIKSSDEVDLASEVHSMVAVGRSSRQIVDELNMAVSENPNLLAGVLNLPHVLLRDDAVDLLDRTLLMLEQRGHHVDLAVYGGLMSSQLRHRNFIGVAETAARVSSFTPKMRATLAAAAVHRGRLEESLEHLRQIPYQEGARSLVSPASTCQILTLAAQEGLLPTVSEELHRVGARADQKQLDTVITESRRYGPSVVRQLLLVAQHMRLPKSPVGYRALAASIGESADRVELTTLLEELEEEASQKSLGLPVGESLALALLSACKVGDESSVRRVVELYCAACVGAPGGRVLCSACHTLLKLGDDVSACDFFERELLARRVKPDTSLTELLMKAASKTGKSTLLERLSESHLSTSAQADITRCANMIQGYTRDRDLTSAVAVFKKLGESAEMSPLVCNCLLEAYLQCGDLDAGMAHFEEMKRRGCVDVVGFNTMLKAHLASGAQAEALLQEMVARGLRANKVTFNELINAKVVAGDVNGMWNLLQRMKDAGMKASSVTCSILLKSLTVHSRSCDVQRVMDLIADIEEPIDEVLFSSVIEACTRIKQLSPLSDLMRRRQRRPTNLSAPTYGAMIKAYGQAGDVERVRELWAEMAELGVKPTSITFGCMAEALVANGHADEAWELVRGYSERGCVNTVIYSTVLKGFAASRQIDKVFAAYTDMQSKGILCNTISYNTLLHACAKCGAMDRASGFLEDMKQSRVEPDVITYSTLVKGYCLEGDVDRAFSMLEEMRSDEKFLPDEIMYNSILDGCAKQHRVEDALRVLDEMKVAGVGPSNYTLSILVKLLGNARRLNMAFNMVDDLSQRHGFRLNVQVYTCLVQACIINRRLERALKLHDKMIADECITDNKFYTALARGCLQMHQPLKAADVVRASYNLPSSLAVSKGAYVGMERRTLEEIVAKLQSGGGEEVHSLTSLAADLRSIRGIVVHCTPTSLSRRKGECRTTR